MRNPVGCEPMIRAAARLAAEPLSVTFRRTREFPKSTCGECEYEEADGELRWQCVKCALTDAFTGHVLLLAQKGQ